MRKLIHLFIAIIVGLVMALMVFVLCGIMLGTTISGQAVNLLAVMVGSATAGFIAQRNGLIIGLCVGTLVGNTLLYFMYLALTRTERVLDATTTTQIIYKSVQLIMAGTICGYWGQLMGMRLNLLWRRSLSKQKK